MIFASTLGSPPLSGASSSLRLVCVLVRSRFHLQHLQSLRPLLSMMALDQRPP
jgi:hypothetical protein